jgi:hypothetical protein
VDNHKCLNCEKPITWKFAICSDCEKIYGNTSTQWPDWLRYLWSQTQRERRREKNKRQHEVPIDLSGETYEDIYDGDQ